jgi:hypothetical protein
MGKRPDCTDVLREGQCNRRLSNELVAANMAIVATSLAIEVLPDKLKVAGATSRRIRINKSPDAVAILSKLNWLGSNPFRQSRFAALKNISVNPEAERFGPQLDRRLLSL